jgi:hypothetical protein
MAGIVDVDHVESGLGALVFTNEYKAISRLIYGYFTSRVRTTTSLTSGLVLQEVQNDVFTGGTGPNDPPTRESASSCDSHLEGEREAQRA